MAFVTGTLVIDAPASALNNAGPEAGERADNTIAVKRIRTRAGDYPYVSAQAVRYWLRTYLERSGDGWKTAPTYKESENLAYTAADPLDYWDDDLFGYMRAPEGASLAKRKEDPEYKKLTPLEEKKKDGKLREVSLTRISPFRVGTVVSIAPVRVVNDWGTMARHNGDPVIYEHQFYRATLQGLFSLSLSTAGTFFNGGRVGYRNLDEVRVKKATDAKLEAVTVHGQPAFRLGLPDRAQRVAVLLRALGELEGGAKLSLHYTDVTPPLAIAAVVRGGNNPFARVVRADAKDQPEFSTEAFKEVLSVYRDQILSNVHLGWSRGYLDSQRAAVEALTSEERSGVTVVCSHPRDAFRALAESVEKQENREWFD